MYEFPPKRARLAMLARYRLAFVLIGTGAAGASWTLVTANAPWAARTLHTSVIDAAGSIYVLGGGLPAGPLYDDVWRSTDRGVLLLLLLR